MSLGQSKKRENWVTQKRGRPKRVTDEKAASPSVVRGLPHDNGT